MVLYNELEQNRDAWRKACEKAQQQRDLLVAEYERALHITPSEGYVHCVEHLYNALKNPRCDIRVRDLLLDDAEQKIKQLRDNREFWRKACEEAQMHRDNAVQQNELLHGELAELVRENAMLRELALSVEWVQPMYNGNPSCPYCGNQQHWGHAEGCELVAADLTAPAKPRTEAGAAKDERMTAGQIAAIQRYGEAVARGAYGEPVSELMWNIARAFRAGGEG